MTSALAQLPAISSVQFRAWAAGMTATALANADSCHDSSLRLVRQAFTAADPEQMTRTATAWACAGIAWGRLADLAALLDSGHPEAEIAAAERLYASALADTAAIAWPSPDSL